MKSTANQSCSKYIEVDGMFNGDEMMKKVCTLEKEYISSSLSSLGTDKPWYGKGKGCPDKPVFNDPNYIGVHYYHKKGDKNLNLLRKDFKTEPSISRPKDMKKYKKILAEANKLMEEKSMTWEDSLEQVSKKFETKGGSRKTKRNKRRSKRRNQNSKRRSKRLNKNYLRKTKLNN